MKNFIEDKQIWLYAIIIPLAGLIGIYAPKNAPILEALIPYALGALMYAMFSQIPFFELKKALSNKRYLIALLISNFIMVPVIVWGLIQFLPNNIGILIGVLLVLLTPCIDYVIVFTKIGKGNAELVLASTPLLFIVQMILLPLYLALFAGNEFIEIISIAPFIEAFLTLIFFPLLLALYVQWSASKTDAGKQALSLSGWLPVPLMALVLLLIISSQLPKMINELESVFIVIPIYIVFIGFTFIGAWMIGKLFKLEVPAKRALIFSTSTRNSLVVLPFALALPGELSTIASAVIVTQTVVELIGELIYIKAVPRIVKLPVQQQNPT